ncbi:radical SAM protein [Amycolatopsis sp. NPDC003731]
MTRLAHDSPPVVTRWQKQRANLDRRRRWIANAGRGLVDPTRPILVHLVPIRRCNLACAYCNEYDKTSPPVPLDVLCKRIDEVARLGAFGIGFSGGEPTLHPQLDELVRHVRARGMMAGLITNGYRLNPRRISAMNDAGLDYLQISIDNVEPDETSMKSLRVLDRRLDWLKTYATFDVNINSVVGGGIRNPDDAYTIALRAHELGFSTSVGIIHDGSGTLRPLSAAEREVYRKIRRLSRGGAALLGQAFATGSFQDNLAEGRPNDWHCRAGARYLYVDEAGIVSYCSQQRGTPGVPVAEYTLDMLREHFRTPKACAPLCTVTCVHRVSEFDKWRAAAPPREGGD